MENEKQNTGRDKTPKAEVSQFVQVLRYRCNVCGRVGEVVEKPSVCGNQFCSSNKRPAIKQIADESVVRKQQRIARIDSEFKRGVISKEEADRAKREIDNPPKVD